MADILKQLGINSSFFIQFGLFFVLFLIISQTYFKPFLKLIELRHKRTVSDREAAEQLMAQAQAKLDEYQRRLAAERAAIRSDADALMAAAKKEEASILASAREEAKKITQEAADAVEKQRTEIRAKLNSDVEAFANQVSDALLARRGG